MYKIASLNYCLLISKKDIKRSAYNWDVYLIENSDGVKLDSPELIGSIPEGYILDQDDPTLYITSNRDAYITESSAFIYDGIETTAYTASTADPIGRVRILLQPVPSQEATKSYAHAVGCTLATPSSTYADNRLIREPDVLPLSPVTVYYCNRVTAVGGHDNRTSMSIPLEGDLWEVADWQDAEHFQRTQLGMRYMTSKVETINGGRIVVSILPKSPVYVYNLLVVSVGTGKVLHSWDLSQSKLVGQRYFTAVEDCYVTMTYAPYCLQATKDYFIDSNTYQWVYVSIGTLSRYVTSYSTFTDSDLSPSAITNALSAYRAHSVNDGENLPLTIRPTDLRTPMIVSKGTYYSLVFTKSAYDLYGTKGEATCAYISDYFTGELIRILDIQDATTNNADMVVWSDLIVDRPSCLHVAVKGSAQVSTDLIQVQVIIDEAILNVEFKGNTGDVTHSENVYTLWVKPYLRLTIKYQCDYLSRLSSTHGEKIDFIKFGECSFTSQPIVSKKLGGEYDTFTYHISSYTPTIVFTDRDAVNADNFAFTGGDAPFTKEEKQTITFDDGDVSIGYVVTTKNGSTNRNYTSLSKTIQNNLNLLSIEMYSDVGDGNIITIPEYFLTGCTALTSFALNTTLNPIVQYRSHAFEDCTSLSSFKTSNNLVLFSDHCFCRAGIKTLTLAQSRLQSIGDYCFSDSKLLTITLPPSILYLRTYCFLNTGLQSIMTSNLGGIATNSLLFRTENSTLNNNLTYIDKGVFSGCEKLAFVLLPSSIKTLYEFSFEKCNGIRNFQSEGLTFIHNNAFKDTWLEGVPSDTLDMNTTLYTPNHSRERLLYKVPQTTGVYFDCHISNLGGVTSRHSACTYVSPKSDNSVLILYKCNEKQKGGLGGGGYLYSIHKNTISISPYAFSGNYDYGNIGYYCDSLYSESDIRTDSKLQKIGTGAFKDNSGLMAFRFPKKGTVTYLGDKAFQNCSNLTEIFNFKQQPISKIEDYTFMSCGKNTTGIGASVGIYNNSEFYIPDTVTSIGNYAFANCPQLMSIANLTTCNITSLGHGAFQGCFKNTAWRTKTGKEIALFTIILAATIASCVFGAWEAAGYFTAMGVWILEFETGVFIGTLAAGATGSTASAGAAGAIEVGSANEDKESWHQQRNKTAEIFLPKVTQIGTYCFEDCSHLGVIGLNYQIQEIPKKAFSHCKKLHTMLFLKEFDINSTATHKSIPPEIHTIGEEAFCHCLNLSHSTIRQLVYNAVCIKKDAFKGCSLNGKDLIIPKSVSSLEEGALGFDGKGVFIFPSKTPPNNVHPKVFADPSRKTLLVRAGCKTAYLEKFPQISSKSIIEHADTSEMWSYIKDMGYEL